MNTKVATYRKRLHQSFKAAKLYLEANESEGNQYGAGKVKFICHSIDRAEGGGHITELQMKEAVSIIMKRLEGHRTACLWLRSQIGDRAVDRAGQTAVQQWRHLWLDQLIQEFSK